MSRHATVAQRRRSHLRWGAGTLLLAAVAVYATFGGALPLRGGYDVHAIFSSASQVKAGVPVRIAGVNVGKVRSVRRGPGTTAIVTMRLDDAARPVHRDATAKIRPRLFLEGNFFVDLRPGTPGAPELAAGGTIPLGQTAIPVQFDQVLSALRSGERQGLRTVLRELDAALRRGGAEGIRRSAKASASAFTSFARLAEAARGTEEHDLSRLIASGARVTGALATRRRALADLVTQFDRTMAAFADHSSQVGASLRGLDRVTAAAYPALADLNAALPPARRLAAEVRPLARRAPRTLDLALPLVTELDRLVSPRELPPLLADLRPALRSLAGLEPRLTSLLAKVAPVTRCVADNVLPVLTAKVDDGRLSTGRRVYEELLAANVGLASASQDFDGNGPSVRYLASFGDQVLSLGQAAGATQLYELLDQPLIGSRPQRPGSKPPFRPDVPCATQDPVSLKAPMRRAAASRRNAAPALSAAAVAKVLRAAKADVTRRRGEAAK
jgi:virulence factor Mce-like protein